MIPTKAIIAVAGYGTRRLPVSKSIEKCMLPLLNRPIVDYVVEDLAKAGVTDIYFVVSGTGEQLRSYYERDMELEAYLRKNGKAELIPSILPPEQLTFHYIEQDRNDPRHGTSVPAWLCRDYIRQDEQFYFLGGDQCLWRADGQSEAALLAEAVHAAGVSAGMIGVAVPEDEVEKYGIIRQDEQGHFQEIVEKPKRDEAPSNLNNATFYLLPGSFMQLVAEQVAQPHEGEYYITDAVNTFVARQLLAVRASDAVYLDCGTVDGWVQSNSFLLSQQ